MRSSFFPCIPSVMIIGRLLSYQGCGWKGEMLLSLYASKTSLSSNVLVSVKVKVASSRIVP